MERFSSRVLLVLCVAVSSSTVVSAHWDSPWGWEWHKSPPPPDGSPPPPLYPSPYYDSPPSGSPPSPYYDSPPSGSPPYDPPPSGASPPYYSPPDGASPPPYHDAPPHGAYPPGDPWKQSLFELKTAPIHPPSEEPSMDQFHGLPPSSAPTFSTIGGPTYASMPWLAISLIDNPDQWPSPYKPLTTVEEAFGPDAEKVYGEVSLLDGLSSKGDDGYSQLLKEGITALLNSVDKGFKFKEEEIKKCFSFKKALKSESTATIQAHMFEDANNLYAASHT